MAASRAVTTTPADPAVRGGDQKGPPTEGEKREKKREKKEKGKKKEKKGGVC